MEIQNVREAQKRVQFVAEVYDYQSVQRDSPDGTWMPPTRHWVGDIFDTTICSQWRGRPIQADMSVS